MDRAEGVREHYRAEGAVAERERIIALIFDEENLALAWLITRWYYGGENKDRSKAVALFKGEQK